VESVKGAVAIVTGASGGFGRPICVALAAEGARIMACAVPQESGALVSLVEEIQAAGGDAAWRTLDVSDPRQCSALVDETVKEMGSLRLLVNCAGVGHWVPVEKTTDAQWRQTLEVNLSGAFYLSRAAIAPMRRAGGGHIVNIASVLGRRGAPNFAAYCASKAAVMAFSESLAKEVKEDRIQVSVVAPGTADTGFRKSHAGRPQTPDLTDPERMLRASDVAEAVLWVIQASRHVASVQVILEPLG
jgi:3-oxoacyl-[acyl-carrier protein] reductase